LGLNETATLTLLRDRAYVGENSYGQFYLYQVKDQQGEERSYFATPDVHQQILENGLKSGDQFQVKKVAIQNGRKVTSKIGFEVVKKAEASPVPPSANGNGHDDGFKELMEKCVQDAVEIVKVVNTIPWQNEDVRSIALTMFIQRARA
jgi:hypothetical protein